MNRLSSMLLTAALCAPLSAQVCGALLPSGQPALAGMAPTCRGLVAPAAVWAGGNPGFALHSALLPPVPVGRPMLLLVGVPTPPPIPLFPPLLNGGFGVPGLLAMNPVLLVLPAGVSGTIGNPAVPLPLPKTGGPLGLVLSAQTAAALAGGDFALGPAVGIWI